jgi:hypothetical protein
VAESDKGVEKTSILVFKDVEAGVENPPRICCIRRKTANSDFGMFVASSLTSLRGTKRWGKKVRITDATSEFKIAILRERYRGIKSR